MGIIGNVAITSAEKMATNKEKCGSVKNAMKYGTKQYVNSSKTLLKDAFVTTTGLAVSVGAAKAVSKSETAQKAVQKVIQKGLDLVKNSNFSKDVLELAEKATPYLTKATKWVGALPTPAKAVLAAGAVVTGIASNLIRAKGMLNKGEINKEMEISAKLERQQNKQNKELLG